MAETKSIEVFQKKKWSHLVQSIIIDSIGMTSYLIPVVAEVTDIVVAPILGIWIFLLYRNRIGVGLTGGIIGVLEELLPSTDLVPTAVIMWVYTYVVRKGEED